jgi:hypothetical protein
MSDKAGKTGKLTVSLIQNPLSIQKGLLPYYAPQASVKLKYYECIITGIYGKHLILMVKAF